MSEFRPLKPYLTTLEQLAQLKTRGLFVSDDAIGCQDITTRFARQIPSAFQVAKMLLLMAPPLIS
jgi:hypothetical protein